MIHWTRQVKVVGRQHQGGLGRVSPLDELAFWRARLADLTGISDQLRSPGVLPVLHISSGLFHAQHEHRQSTASGVVDVVVVRQPRSMHG